MPKPHIEKVFEAFQRFNASVTRICGTLRPGQMEAALQEARAELREALEGMGLAEHIDWSNPLDGEG